MHGDISSYALEHGLSKNDLIELRGNIPDDLTKLGFHIDDSPTITFRYLSMRLLSKRPSRLKMKK
jgi:hypothetical protein